MSIIKKFDEFLNESHWSEMNRRSQGITVRKENNVNSLDYIDFFEYLKNRYKEYCGGNFINRRDNYITFYLEPGCPLYIRYNDNGKIKEITTELFDKDSFSTFEEELESKNVRHNLTADFNGSGTLEIKDKNGNTSNRTVIEFIDNYLNYVIDGDGHKILFKICDKLRPDYEKGKEITLDKILDVAKHELVVNRYPEKNRFFNFIEKNYGDIIYIIQNNISINESHWSEMNRRSQGVTVRKEDGLVDGLNVDEFFDYLKSVYIPTTVCVLEHYTITVQKIVVPVLMSGLNESAAYVCMIGFENNDLSVIIDDRSWHRLHGRNKIKIRETYDLEFVRKTRTIQGGYVKITKKTGEPTTNSFFIEVIDFILNDVQPGDTKLVEKIR